MNAPPADEPSNNTPLHHFVQIQVVLSNVCSSQPCFVAPIDEGGGHIATPVPAVPGTLILSIWAVSVKNEIYRAGLVSCR